MKIYVDLDGVVLDIGSAIEEEMHRRGYTDFSKNRVLTYDFNKSLIDKPFWLTSTQYKDFGDGCFLNAPVSEIYSLFSSVDFYKTIKPYDNAITSLELFMELENIEIVFYSLSFSEEVARYKGDFLDRLFPYGNYRYEFEIGDIKSCNKDADIILEDSLENLSKYSDCGAKLILISQPYNSLLYNKAYERLSFDRRYSLRDALESIFSGVLLNE